ncbi:hypothetical protein CBI36_03290 [Acetobacter oryzifermentans]|uniref:Secreted protein n=1 Tax=Acetobacter oryzifermentans TaxID=1633874 RepID=A0ABC8CBA4_9PROT|nr:hypothetical protein CBI36_03290 [Acetobacter oryzifermentans]
MNTKKAAFRFAGRSFFVPNFILSSRLYAHMLLIQPAVTSAGARVHQWRLPKPVAPAELEGSKNPLVLRSSV